MRRGREPRIWTINLALALYACVWVAVPWLIYEFASLIYPHRVHPQTINCGDCLAPDKHGPTQWPPKGKAPP